MSTRKLIERVMRGEDPRKVLSFSEQTNISRDDVENALNCKVTYFKSTPHGFEAELRDVPFNTPGGGTTEVTGKLYVYSDGDSGPELYFDRYILGYPGGGMTYVYEGPVPTNSDELARVWNDTANWTT